MKKKQDAGKLSPQAQEALRLRIVDYLKTGKGTQKQAAEIFAFSIEAIKKIWNRYKQGGVKALKRIKNVVLISALPGSPGYKQSKLPVPFKRVHPIAISCLFICGQQMLYGG